MTESAREAWITGIGIVSCLGEGPDAHWQALNERRIVVDSQSYAPYVIHPLAPIDFDKQIPKKGDQRQMEPWQRIGTYVAGLALDDAGLKGNAELLSRMDLIVAAGRGERDVAVDTAILSGLPRAADPGSYLNERLLNDLRPTLFLAQLSNLMAGNISIVHGVTGSSRTFMGEEAAGVDAARIGLARVKTGQSEMVLIGGAQNANRQDKLFDHEFGGSNWKGEHVPVWQRGPEGGFALGSAGAFFVLESRTHAERRGAKPLVRLSAVLSDRCRREPGMAAEALDGMWAKLQPRSGSCALISGASGAEPATAEERSFLQRHRDVAVRAPATQIGHTIEAQFSLNLALAAISLSRGTLFAPGDDSGMEKPFDGSLRQAVVTSVGHWRGEGVALVETVTEGEQDGLFP